MRLSPLSRSWALVSLVSLVWAPLGAATANAPATLTGSIVRTADQAPLAGARLHAGDPKTGKIYSSTPATDDGSFVLGELPAATYRLAVESAGGLYVVETPLAVAAGTAQTLTLAVSPSTDGDGSPDDDDGDGWSFWDNPYTAALTLLGLAAIVGIAIGGKSDSPTPSPSQP